MATATVRGADPKHAHENHALQDQVQELSPGCTNGGVLAVVITVILVHVTLGNRAWEWSEG